MSTLAQIHEAQIMEGAAKACKMYQCSGQFGKTIQKYLDYKMTRVHRRLVSLERGNWNSPLNVECSNRGA